MRTSKRKAKVIVTKRSTIFMLTSLFAAPREVFAQSTRLQIEVALPSDRYQTGTLTLKDSADNAILKDIEVLGKADNRRALDKGNASRDPIMINGDTPTGNYDVPRLVSTGSGTGRSERSFGPHGALVLNPRDGQAAAAKANGRTGLLIHGGAPGANGRLRATLGCLRLSNNDMDRLLQAIANAGNNVVFQRCEVVELSVLVGGPSDEGAGDDEQDPPNDIDAILNPAPLVKP